MTGPELRAIRKSLKLTQAELGRAIGWKRRQIVAWEMGEAPVPPRAEIAISNLEMLRQHYGPDPTVWSLKDGRVLRNGEPEQEPTP